MPLGRGEADVPSEVLEASMTNTTDGHSSGTVASTELSNARGLDHGESTATAQSAPTSASDRVLLARLRRHEPGAFEAVVRLHQDRVYDFCVRMLADKEEAFDLTQEIFLAVHQNVERFRADAKLGTWILRIARNHCLNRIKYLKRRGRGQSDELSESNEVAVCDSLGGSSSPHEVVVRKREQQLVHQAIELLDEEQRSLVILRDVEGLTYEEIMEITELPGGTVKSRLHRAREKLAGILTQLESAFGTGGE
jgi:RNA polymerase sigma-70 factor (ECF subfamily)